MPTVPLVHLAARTIPDHDELALITRSVAGDRAAQHALFIAQRELVHRTLFRILGKNHDMEDLLQDTFIQIFRSLARFRGESSFARWCGIIATRVAWNYIEHRPGIPSSMDDVELHQVAGPVRDAEADFDARDAARRLYSHLDRMDVKLRISFTLAVVDGRPLAEVAILTNASLVAVKTRVWRARRELERRASKDVVLAAYLAQLGSHQ